MFTGIVEATGKVVSVARDLDNVHFGIECTFTEELRVDQSVAHNGVCLTVVSIEGNVFKVTAVSETLQRTNLGRLKPGDMVNLERSMMMNGRIDGHMVQGHVDCTAECVEAEDRNGSWRFAFRYQAAGEGMITVEKGSVCVNGVSLTVVDSEPGFFSVAVIPYTFENTTFRNLRKGDTVNIEFDIIGKYVARYLALQQKA
jgi:riboflavin synthase